MHAFDATRLAQCAALQDYVLVNGQRMSVHIYSRGEHGQWVVQPVGSGDTVVIPSLDVHIPMAQLYVAVRLPAEP